MKYYQEDSNKISRIFTIKSKPFLVFLVLVLLVIFGGGDYLTGYELTFNLFYLVPVVIATWSLGIYPGIVFSVIAAITIYSVDLLSGHVFTNPLIRLWNVSMELCIFLFVVFLLSGLKRALRTEKNLARTDNLTGLGNQQLLLERLRYEIDRSRRYNRILTVAFFDCDDFKNINDRFGHQTGNQFLRIIGDVLRQNLRAVDTIIRAGGDEFILILPETDIRVAGNIVQKIVAGIDAALKNHAWQVRFSIGVATFIKPPESIDEVLRKADEAMYAAKKAGKNTVVAQLYE
jgi:diguanylate cyclase (GGDEF)-like protein